MSDVLMALAEPAARCCGTCRAWTARRGMTGAWCPVLCRELPHDLTRVVCGAWVREVRESEARELWAALGGVEVER